MIDSARRRVDLASPRAVTADIARSTSAAGIMYPPSSGSTYLSSRNHVASRRRAARRLHDSCHSSASAPKVRSWHAGSV